MGRLSALFSRKKLTSAKTRLLVDQLKTSCGVFLDPTIRSPNIQEARALKVGRQKTSKQPLFYFVMHPLAPLSPTTDPTANRHPVSAPHRPVHTRTGCHSRVLAHFGAELCGPSAVTTEPVETVPPGAICRREGALPGGHRSARAGDAGRGDRHDPEVSSDGKPLAGGVYLRRDIDVRARVSFAIGPAAVEADRSDRTLPGALGHKPGTAHAVRAADRDRVAALGSDGILRAVQAGALLPQQRHDRYQPQPDLRATAWFREVFEEPHTPPLHWRSVLILRHDAAARVRHRHVGRGSDRVRFHGGACRLHNDCVRPAQSNAYGPGEHVHRGVPVTLHRFRRPDTLHSGLQGADEAARTGTAQPEPVPVAHHLPHGHVLRNCAGDRFRPAAGAARRATRASGASPAAGDRAPQPTEDERGGVLPAALHAARRGTEWIHCVRCQLFAAEGSENVSQLSYRSRFVDAR